MSYNNSQSYFSELAPDKLAVNHRLNKNGRLWL